MDSKSCFILGLPSAGKTSYLAALAYSLQQKQVETKLHWESFSGDHQYLASLAETWLTAEPVSRTSTGLQQTSLTICLSDCEGKIFNITFPDLSGETFQKQYVDREIDGSMADSIINGNGILVFINPREIIEPALISELPLEHRLKPVPNTEILEREPANADPTEVQIVELLQDIEFLTKNKRYKKVPLSIIVSAWDIVDASYSIPETCIRERIPLLWQFLKANDDIFLTSYYGVSAQGGSLDTGEESEYLIDQFETNPAERIVVVNNAGEKSHDITLPLWEVMNK
ncbi:TRAFAC clade GTPase domain-containing protein [Ruminiclostridium cellobioparum]|uniref:Double-GTPase 1 domain-containing protein n=1 Tax=Ruminiclostridium cellobioparum subsp. termitidis CT1112 TaxID=1195236 RepID=S0FLM3_RUMCE|nr:hypothetical protein [Ruminiclostridium cellobioparum]EMS72802.1 hypothetical protein CTER_1509 [Ruminiclostridium cellobioparum subsp. termitidis CT1112]